MPFWDTGRTRYTDYYSVACDLSAHLLCSTLIYQPDINYLSKITISFSAVYVCLKRRNQYSNFQLTIHWWILKQVQH